MAARQATDGQQTVGAKRCHTLADMAAHPAAHPCDTANASELTGVTPCSHSPEICTYVGSINSVLQSVIRPADAVQKPLPMYDRNAPLLCRLDLAALQRARMRPEDQVCRPACMHAFVNSNVVMKPRNDVNQHFYRIQISTAGPDLPKIRSPLYSHPAASARWRTC
jgi:hypothetical protein